MGDTTIGKTVGQSGNNVGVVSMQAEHVQILHRCLEFGIAMRVSSTGKLDGPNQRRTFVARQSTKPAQETQSRRLPPQRSKQLRCIQAQQKPPRIAIQRLTIGGWHGRWQRNSIVAGPSNKVARE